MDKAPLLQVEDLRKHFRVRDKAGGKSLVRAVDGASLSLARGETLGIVGESGCGKTTLGRTILRLVEPDGGTIRYTGADITHAGIRPYRAKMQIIFQDPYGSLDPRTRIIDSVAEGIRIHRPDASKAARRQKAAAFLERVGLTPDCALRYPHEISGGQQQRVGIARALAVGPELVVCDEPLSSLDVSMQSQIVNLLEDIQDREGLAYLFISHDLAVVRHIAHRVGVMYLGKLVETGTGDDVIRHPAHPYTRSLVAAVPAPDPRAGRDRTYRITEASADFGRPERGCRYSGVCEYATGICFEEEPAASDIAAGHSCACHLHT